ncbi:hypothetical protein [Pseudomonas moraviensis]
MESDQGAGVAIENLMVTLHQLPEIKAVVDTGTDLVTLFGFILTAVAVMAGAWVSVFTYKRTASNQMTLAKAAALKESRQAWINELRDTCADYVAAVGILQTPAQAKLAHQVFISKIDAHDKATAASLTASWEEKRRRLMQSAFSLSAKIHLLSNPKEPAFQGLLNEVQVALKNANTIENSVFDNCGRIVSIAQGILKTEWIRVKQME